MYNAAVVRQLCAHIVAEKDPLKVEELLDLLHGVLREDREEIRLRIAHLVKKYADVIDESKAAD